METMRGPACQISKTGSAGRGAGMGGRGRRRRRSFMVAKTFKHYRTIAPCALAHVIPMNPVMDSKMYCRVTGIALAATALLGIVLELTTNGAFLNNFLAFDWPHDILHVVLALGALGAGFAAGGAYSRMYARIFGIVYTGLAVAGFVSAGVVSFVGIHLELGENLIHLVIGAWGILAGFFGSTTPGTTTGPRRA
jgi:hypothetical protein